MTLPVNFYLHAFRINERRTNSLISGNKDTVTIAVNLVVDGKDYGTQHHDMGDLGDTGIWYGVDLGFKGIEVSDTSTLEWRFVMMNAGADRGAALHQKLTDDALKTEISLSTITAFPTGGASIIVGGAIAGATFFASLLNRDCDGPVASDGFKILGKDFFGHGHPTVSFTKNYPGVDSPHGCGGNSNYDVCCVLKQTNQVFLVNPKAELSPNQELKPGESLQSPSSDFRLTFEKDGNLILFDERIPAMLWNSKTGNTPNPRNAVMQGDGNFCIYNTNNDTLWHTHSDGHPGAHLRLQDDGNFYVYTPPSDVVWNASTNIY